MCIKVAYLYLGFRDWGLGIRDGESLENMDIPVPSLIMSSKRQFVAINPVDLSHNLFNFPR
jgi:hypothetical protein